MVAPKRLCKLCSNRTLFLLCDVQEKFRNVIHPFDSMLTNINKLLRIGRGFNVPLIGTEQYPEKLGKTCKELDTGGIIGMCPKTKFTMYIPEVLCLMKENLKEKPSDVVIFGIETHICVLQSSIDFLENDFRVHVVLDCVLSRLHQDRDVAVKLLRDIGCFVQTSESIAFSLLQDKINPEFPCVREAVAKTSANMQLSRMSFKPKGSKKKPKKKKS